MRLPSDDEGALAALASPPPPWTQAEVAEELMRTRRNALLLRAVDEGVVDPARDFPGEEYSPTHLAIALDNLALLRALILGKGVSPNVRSARALTPLRCAVGEQQEEAALWLINQVPGVDLDAGAVDDSTPLMVAARDGLLLVIQALLSKGVAVNALDLHGCTALGYAISHKQEEAALYLITQAPGIDPNVRMSKGMTALMVASRMGLLRVVEALVARGAEVDARDEQGTTALGYALEQCRENAITGQERVALFLLGTARADVRVKEQSTLLAPVTCMPRLFRVMVRRLREAGTDDAALQDNLAGTAVWTIAHSRLSSLRVLMEMGLDPNQQAIFPGPADDDFEHPTCRTPLHVACLFKNREAAALLLERGADPLVYDDSGFFPHHYATYRGSLPLLQLLLARCPTIGVDAESRDGRTAWDMARLSGHEDVKAYLEGLQRAAEAAWARARNQRRREKKKRGRARRRRRRRRRQQRPQRCRDRHRRLLLARRR